MLIGGCSSILQDSLPQAKELEKDYDYYDESWGYNLKAKR